MNDLDLVTVIDASLRPIDTTHDAAVELDGNAFLRKRKIVDQAREINRFIYIARLTVKRDRHMTMIARMWNAINLA